LKTPLLLAVIAAALYVPRLGDAPIYLSPDEVFIARNAHAIATTGHDSRGRFLPLYIEYRYPTEDPTTHKRVMRSGWLPPTIYYAMAVVLRILPLSEASARLPTAIVGILNVVLVYFVGRRLFGSEPLAIVSALLLALTPAHFIHSRLGLDYLYPLPFVLAWLLWLLEYLDGGRDRRLFWSALALGVGLYSYIAATIIMPLFCALTLVVLWWERRPARAYGLVALGFLIPALLYIPWLVAHPSAASDVLAKYGVQNAREARAFFTFHGIGDQVSRLWTFFDPRFLFFDGCMELIYGTRTAGVFLLALAPLLAAGLWAITRPPVTGVALLLIGGLVLSPVPATVLLTRDAIYRALEMLPFAALLSGFGVRLIWSAPASSPQPGALARRFRAGQLVACGLLATVPLQFAFFYVDYMTDYRLRTALIFSGNIRGALEETIREADEEHAPAIQLGRIGAYGRGGDYWSFYLIKYRRSDLAARSVDVGEFEPEGVLALPAGSVIVTNAGEGKTDAVIDKLVAAGQLSRTPVKEPDGFTTFWVLRRTGR
jgi:4-amino-4-deoxy-L-arabinose transferase-like glycosyltransferase